jgi:hypothetical protein
MHKWIQSITAFSNPLANNEDPPGALPYISYSNDKSHLVLSTCKRPIVISECAEWSVGSTGQPPFARRKDL